MDRKDVSKIAATLALSVSTSILAPTVNAESLSKPNLVYYYIQKADGSQDIGWNDPANAVTLKLVDTNGILSWQEGPRAYLRSDPKKRQKNTIQVAIVTSRPDDANQIQESLGSLTIPRQARSPMYIPQPHLIDADKARQKQYLQIIPLDKYYIGVTVATDTTRHNQKVLLTEAWKKLSQNP